MVLTPDQKKRLAELGGRSAEEEKRKEDRPQVFAAKLKSRWLIVRASGVTGVAVKVLLLCLALGVAGYFLVDYQLHRINFREVLSSRAPVDGLLNAVKLQKRKADMLDKGRAEFLIGDYKAALATAEAVEKLDQKDSRASSLIDLAADASTRRATREFDSGEIETALVDVRLALKYRPKHEDAKELSLRIAERLLREAQVHYNKKEYSQLITKAQEVGRINPSDARVSNLLIRTNNELLARVDELFISKRHYDALERVYLSLRIDPTNPRALRRLKQISLYIETPDLKLRGISRLGDTHYAIIQLSQTNRPVYVKEGDTVRNFKVVDIDSDARTVKLVQIHTKHEFTIELPKTE